MKKISQNGMAIVTLDLHGMNLYQAELCIEAQLRRSWGVYRIRLIHGYRQGSRLRDFIRERYSSHPAVLRLESNAEGHSDLILREC